MSTNKTTVENTNEDYTMESSINDARWLFGFVLFSGLAVFAAGIVASMIAA